MTATYYLHTMEGEPAYFDGDQIVFVSRGRHAAVLVDSLATIRKQIRATEQFRLRHGFSFDPEEHCYVRVRLPAAATQEET